MLSLPPPSPHAADFLICLRVASLGCAPGELHPPCTRGAAAASAAAATPSWDAALRQLRASWRPTWQLRLACVTALLAPLLLLLQQLLLPAAPRAPLLPLPAASLASLLAALCCAWACLPRRVVAERVLAVAGVGLQCIALREDGTLLWRPLLRADAVAGVALHEGLQRCGVEWFICAMPAPSQPQQALFLPLLHARPRLPGLIEVLRGLRGVFPVVN